MRKKKLYGAAKAAALRRKAAGLPPKKKKTAKKNNKHVARSGPIIATDCYQPKSVEVILDISRKKLNWLVENTSLGPWTLLDDIGRLRVLRGQQILDYLDRQSAKGGAR